MKFVSKQSNYRITLSPGIPGNALLGNPPKPAIYVKFEDGIANIDDENLVEMMKKHPAFLKGDFIEMSDGTTDPYSATRKSMEPQHNIEIMENGVAKNITPKPLVSFTTEQKKVINEMIADSVKGALASFVEMNKKAERVIDSNIGKTSNSEIVEETVPVKQAVPNENELLAQMFSKKK